MTNLVNIGHKKVHIEMHTVSEEKRVSSQFWWIYCQFILLVDRIEVDSKLWVHVEIDKNLNN